jgi:actin-like ATPase involved in cell morphogenesis
MRAICPDERLATLEFSELRRPRASDRGDPSGGRVSYSLGVDLGTTFVAAAVSYPGRTEMCTLGDQNVATPSVVYLGDDGVAVTGDAASRRAVSDPDRVSRQFKRRLGDPVPTVLGDTPVGVTELLGLVLRDVVRRVTETEGQDPDRVMLTHPANWGPVRRKLFGLVPPLAGLDNILNTTEPEAAAAHYAVSRRLDDGEIVAVYDLGGGTFDVTVLRKRTDGVEILGRPEGIERLGGVDFDEALLRFVDYRSGGGLTALDLSDPQTRAAMARLRQYCVLAKEALSVDTETVVPVLLPGRHFDVRITRSDFENMIRAQIDSTLGVLSRTLESARVEPADLSAVLLVGGSSRIPLVARMVSEGLGRPIAVDAQPKYAVALGAATLAAAASAEGDGTYRGNGSFRSYSAAAAPDIPTWQPAPPATARMAGAGGLPVPSTASHPETSSGPESSPMFGARAPAVSDPEASSPDVPAGATAVGELPPVTQTTARPMPPEARDRATRGSWRPHLLTAVVVALITAGVVAFVQLKPSSNPGLSAGPSAAPSAATAATAATATATATTTKLVLTAPQVTIGKSYFATASGFSPREPVRFSWTGPTRGTLDASPADSTGRRVLGPIIERDPPGRYTIVATGLNSGSTASAQLEVRPTRR